MKANDLLVSNLHISEDEYSYRGIFTLSAGDKALSIELSDMDNSSIIQEIRSFFSLENSNNEIRETIMNQLVEKAALSSKTTEGKKYQEEKGINADKAAGSLDIA
ncbi:MAG: hypothetical protein N3B21_15560 [Clostridia bacterium]|nr:hypothetical protein [Clostridia bacterium]